jgi:hypothetical protein
VTLNPAQLKQQALAAQKANRKSAQAKARQDAREKKKRLEALREGKFESYMSRVSAQIERDAKAGSLRSSVNIAHFDTYERSSERWEALQPVWEQVAQHFKDQGFEASVRVENHMEWHGDGAGPGPDDIHIEVSWA